MPYCSNGECCNFARGQACESCNESFCGQCFKFHSCFSSDKWPVKPRDKAWYLEWAQRISSESGLLVDTRSNSAYAAGHIRGATNIPSAELIVEDNTYTRSTELPAATSGIRLLLLSEDLSFLRTECVDLLEGGFPADIDHSAIESELPWAYLREHGLVEQGNFSKRLWIPSTSLTRCINQIESYVNHSAAKPARALDLGCGTGRDVVFLATRGWQVTAVDKARLYMNRCRAFADRALSGLPSGEIFALRNILKPGDLQSAVTTLSIDLRPNKCEIKELVAAHSLINLARFMCRELLGDIAEAMQPGAVVAVYHFAEGASSRTGRPFRKEGQTLQSDELETWFGPPLFDVIDKEHTFNIDGQRPMLCFVACKRK